MNKYFKIRPDAESVIYLSATLLFIIVQIWQHASAGLTLPTPWPDESHFLWQAVAFARNFTLFSPELNDSRTIFWMPPGYLILVGLWFKITGVSLLAARHLSLIANIGSFVLLVLALKRFRFPLLNLLIVGAVFTSPGIVASGNVARPEAIVLLLITGSLYFLLKERFWLSLAFVISTPLFHLNGLAFIIGWVATVGIGYGFKGFGRPSKKETMVLCLTVAAWAAYALFALANWADFFHDMSFQYHRKAGRDIAGVLLQPENFLWLLALLILIVVLKKNRSGAAALVFPVIPAWIVVKLGSEMWYDIYYGLAFIGFSVMALQVIAASVERGSNLRRMSRIAVVAIFIIIIYLWGRYDRQLAFRSNPIGDIGWRSMQVENEIPYLVEDEIAELERVLDSLNTEKPIGEIQFIPRAEAFLFPSILRGKYKASHPLFIKRQSDIYLFHLSKYIPSWWRFYVRDDLKDIGYDSLPQGSLILSRDSTEFFYIIRPGDDKTKH